MITRVKYLGRRAWPRGAGDELQPGLLRNPWAQAQGKHAALVQKAEKNLFLFFIFPFSSFSLSNCHGVFRLLFNDRLPQTEDAGGTSGWRPAAVTGREGGREGGGEPVAETHSGKQGGGSRQACQAPSACSIIPSHITYKTQI